MEDVRDEYKNLAPVDLIIALWETSIKNATAHMYCIGAIDALRAMNQLTLEEYNSLYIIVNIPRKKS